MVKMPFCIWTHIRITDGFFTETDFFFCRQCDDLHLQILFSQNRECLTCHRSGNRPGRQIKNLFSQFFPDSFHRRKYGRHRLTDSGRCLDE